MPAKKKTAQTETKQKSKAKVDPKLLEVLICPVTKMPLQYDAKKQELVSKTAGLAFPIIGGIPVMLPDEARKLS